MERLSRLWESVSNHSWRQPDSTVQLKDEPEGDESWAAEAADVDVLPADEESQDTSSETHNATSDDKAVQDRLPLLVPVEGVDSQSRSSGDIDFDDMEDEDLQPAEDFDGRVPGGPRGGGGGFFNPGFEDDGSDLEEDEVLDDDGDADGEMDEEEVGSWDEEAEDDDGEGDDEDEESEEAECFGVEATSAWGAGTSLTEAATKRPAPKIVGYLVAKMTYEMKASRFDVRILEVEMKMALIKFRRRSNKRLRWSHMQVCITLLPAKALKFRTPMLEHRDPRKSALPNTAAAAAEAENKPKDTDADKDKDKDKNKDQAAGKEEKADKRKKGGKRSQSKEASDAAAAKDKKSVVSGIIARRAAQQKQEEERREQWKKQQQIHKQRLEEREKQRLALASGKRVEDTRKDVTKFSDGAKPDSAAAVDESGDKKSKKAADKDVFQITPVYPNQLKKKCPDPIALRFRVYGCYRRKRMFLLGENIFALEGVEEARQTSKLDTDVFRFQLEERKFALSKLKHQSDSEDDQPGKLSAKALKEQQRRARDAVDALRPPPTLGPQLVNQGELFLGLSYNQKNGHLGIQVIQASNLANPKSEKPPTAFVKLRLEWGPFPEKKTAGRPLFKSKTLSVPDCRSPAWHETFAFPVSRTHLNDVSVMVNVYCRHTLNRTVNIGWCSVGRNSCSEEALDHWNEMREASQGVQVSCWHVLLKVSKEKTEGQLDSD